MLWITVANLGTAGKIIYATVLIFGVTVMIIKRGKNGKNSSRKD